MDKEVEDGMEINPTNQRLLIERCARLLKLEELEAPETILRNEGKLIKQAVEVCTPREIAHAMRDFPSVVARLRRIEAQVDAEHPPYPED